jgi:hypothetical protein
VQVSSFFVVYSPFKKKTNAFLTLCIVDEQTAADIVLTEAGLSVIVAAIIQARKIFQRMRVMHIITKKMTTPQINLFQ